MLARQSSIWARLGVAAVTLCGTALIARAGHEVPYYPSFYPQEIRIEPLDAEAAAREFANVRDPLHAYLGAAPRFPGEPPAGLKSVTSLKSLVTVTIDPQSAAAQSREARCQAIARAAATLAPQPDVVPHRYPVTPYHADYLKHVDRIPSGLMMSQAAAPTPVGLVNISERPVAELLLRGGAGPSIWLGPAWAKEGWFQAYHLLGAAVRDSEARRRADQIFERLTVGLIGDGVERINLERELVDTLTRGCDAAVIGFRLRREFYSDDFSNGIENTAVDSQAGFNSPVVLRTLKLKDLPWNGWLRLGIDGRAAAAWNPVAGFSDPIGSLIWSVVGDNAYLPIPYNSAWVPNRVEVRPDEHPPARQSIRIPDDALVADLAPRGLRPAESDDVAMTKLVYRVQASVFHDGSEMETADLVYHYAFAQKWGRPSARAEVQDAAVWTATAAQLARFKAVRVVKVEETRLPIADLTFVYRSPIVEVYLDSSQPDESTNAVVAPPWSPVPWHVLALMDAAVERGIAVYSQAEAERLGRPWLDLVRDPVQIDKLRVMIKEFEQSRYRPAALEHLVTPDAAKARWQALDKFADSAGHLLVTNGPYKLRSVTSDVITLDVVRDFTYPIGIGTFDFYAYPAKALITRVEHLGSRIFVTADAEIAIKQQRDRRLVRLPLQRDTLRGTLPIQPVARYTVVTADGKIAAAGLASRELDGRFAATLPALPTGRYRFYAAIFLDDNTIDPNVGHIDFQVN
jgi:hypothetical protein